LEILVDSKCHKPEIPGTQEVVGGSESKALASPQKIQNIMKNKQ
jgi:hypothetical protein